MNTRQPPPNWFPRRGEVCLIRLDKERPALVISGNLINRYALEVCIVPITSVEHRRFTLRVPLQPGDGGLTRSSWAKCDQVTTVEKSLIRYPSLGYLSAKALSEIESAIKIALALN